MKSGVPKRKHNPKRRIDDTADSVSLARISAKVVYIGSGFHKRSPGDFGLVIPAQPRQNALRRRAHFQAPHRSAVIGGRSQAQPDFCSAPR